jgi:hypothetical protein
MPLLRPPLRRLRGSLLNRLIYRQGHERDWVRDVIGFAKRAFEDRFNFPLERAFRSLARSTTPTTDRRMVIQIILRRLTLSDSSRQFPFAPR